MRDTPGLLLEDIDDFLVDNQIPLLAFFRLDENGVVRDTEVFDHRTTEVEP